MQTEDIKTLYEMIYKRKSFHFFPAAGKEPLTDTDLEGIKKAWNGFTPLYPGIRTSIRVVSGNDVRCRRGEEYCVLLYSEKKDGYLQNAGYLGEQLDLYLVSRGIGTLWFGLGKADKNTDGGLEYVIMLLIRKLKDPSGFRKDMFKSKRKSEDEIWEGNRIDGVTDIVRFAPSACNTQPWKVINREKLFIFRYKKPGKRGIMPVGKVSFFNRIDIGIFLCFMELCLEHKGIGFTRELFSDDGGDGEITLNAVYTFACIERVKKYEALMNEAEQIIGNGKSPEERLKDILKELEGYYVGEEWKTDLEADEAGFFPPDMKRGVLSEDGIYNLLEDCRDILRHGE